MTVWRRDSFTLGPPRVALSGPVRGLSSPKGATGWRNCESCHGTPPEPLLVPFTHGAQVALQAWREEVASMEEGAAGLFLSWLGKLPGFAVRLALIFSYLCWCERGMGDPPGEVTEADMARALDFLEQYAMPMARRCFGEAALPQAERDARRLVRWLQCQRLIPTTLNVRSLRRMQDGPRHRDFGSAQDGAG